MQVTGALATPQRESFVDLLCSLAPRWLALGGDETTLRLAFAGTGADRAYFGEAIERPDAGGAGETVASTPALPSLDETPVRGGAAPSTTPTLPALAGGDPAPEPYASPVSLPSLSLAHPTPSGEDSLP